MVHDKRRGRDDRTNHATGGGVAKPREKRVRSSRLGERGRDEEEQHEDRHCVFVLHESVDVMIQCLEKKVFVEIRFIAIYYTATRVRYLRYTSNNESRECADDPAYLPISWTSMDHTLRLFSGVADHPRDASLDAVILLAIFIASDNGTLLTS